MACCENIPIPNNNDGQEFRPAYIIKRMFKSNCQRKDDHCTHADDETDHLKHEHSQVYGHFLFV
jgi:hypothetical protein